MGRRRGTSTNPQMNVIWRYTLSQGRTCSYDALRLQTKSSGGQSTTGAPANSAWLGLAAASQAAQHTSVQPAGASDTLIAEQSAGAHHTEHVDGKQQQQLPCCSSPRQAPSCGLESALVAHHTRTSECLGGCHPDARDTARACPSCPCTGLHPAILEGP